MESLVSSKEKLTKLQEQAVRNSKIRKINGLISDIKSKLLFTEEEVIGRLDNHKLNIISNELEDILMLINSTNDYYREESKKED